MGVDFVTVLDLLVCLSVNQSVSVCLSGRYCHIDSGVELWCSLLHPLSSVLMLQVFNPQKGLVQSITFSQVLIAGMALIFQI